MAQKTKYMHLFETETEFNDARNNDYTEPWVSYTIENSGCSYNKTEYEKLLETPLTFEITSNGNIKWKTENTAYTCTIEYKKNDGAWTSITSSTGGTNISVVVGDVVQFRGNNAAYSYGYDTINNFSDTTCQFKVKGNIMSLINSVDFSTATTLQSGGTFSMLFYYCTGLTDAGDLLLPATILTEGCYNGMFERCTSLTTAPELPATTLAQYCYSAMFLQCTSLTTTPELPATTLAEACYQDMFRLCTSLNTVPSLPATTLTVGCYYGMFKGCSNLTTLPLNYLPSTTLAEGCYYYMFDSCTSLTTAPELPATTLANSCYKNMFDSCTSLTTAPELPATTLTDYCYQEMFMGCTNLNYIKCLAINISADSCTSDWVSWVQTNSGTFVKNPNMTGWESGSDGIPNNWTVQDA